MSRLTPNVIVLDKGLNLQSPKITAPEGSALDSLNYEQVDFQGQKRIDGYLRYDGQLPSDIQDYMVVTFSGVYEGYTEWDVGDLFYTDKGLYGIVLYVTYGDDDYIESVDVAVINPNAAPIIGRDNTIEYEVQSLQHRSDDAEVSPDDFYNELLDYNNQLRGPVTELPGPVAGLHWFRDRLYAVATVPSVVVEGDGDYPEIYPTNEMLIGSQEHGYIVLAVYQIPGTTQSIVFLDRMDAGGLNEGGLNVGKAGSGDILGQTVERDLTLEPVYDLASFYVARTEQQVLDEDDEPVFGWKHLPTGWIIHFENGNSLYGSLTAINQHPSDTGEPSSTDPASAGKALLLTQNVEISNLPEQVNGWKVSTSPTVYSLEVGALDSVDNYSIYADAFISWDNGEVEAPGADGEDLVEYSPTATVEVDV